MRKAIVAIIVAAAMLFALRPERLHAETNWRETGYDILNAVTGQQKTRQGLSSQEIGAGLKEALKVGTENVVRQLGAVDGFNNDAKVHIPLPQEFATVKAVLARVGMGGMAEDLELRLNRAAEAATPKAKELLWQAIKEMSIDDVKAIYDGPNDAATRYFQGRMSPALAKAMEPVVDRSLGEAGAIQAYERMMGQYKSLPFVPDIKADLSRHVLEKGMAGIFYYLAKEEAAIRQNPAKRTTELLQRVFGANR
ncbi:DUF4197 domain-containing protein [Thiovibrio sp. JS02]